MNRLAKYGLLTVFVAVVANTLVRMITLSVSTVPVGFWPLGWGAVLGSTVLTTGGATIVYGGITRYSKRPNRMFTIVAMVVLLLSFGSFVAPPSVLAAAPTSVLAALAMMHVIVAVVSVGVLTRAADNAETPKSTKNTPT
ncbi:hypothetical protein GCM10009000_066620 [Halobacterium noricense]|uniref:Uncharacterized protein n=1 Tax=Haladaptatus pallidirubidus TaxID=1008152 RepID=A0AAV3UHC3_9EURY